MKYFKLLVTVYIFLIFENTTKLSAEDTLSKNEGSNADINEEIVTSTIQKKLTKTDDKIIVIKYNSSSNIFYIFIQYTNEDSEYIKPISMLINQDRKIELKDCLKKYLEWDNTARKFKDKIIKKVCDIEVKSATEFLSDSQIDYAQDKLFLAINPKKNGINVLYLNLENDKETSTYAELYTSEVNFLIENLDENIHKKKINNLKKNNKLLNDRYK